MENKVTKKLIEDLGIAFNTEVEGHAFYNTAANLVTDERGKNLFTHLATEEIEHIRVVTAFADSVREGRRVVSYSEALKIGAPGKKGLPIYPKENKLLERLKKNQTDLNAVTIAMETEEKAVDFYLKMLKAAENPEEKVLLTKLLEMEKGHLKMLRWERESLVTTGFWCDSMEYSVEKEVE
jgi:rubrerythrin